MKARNHVTRIQKADGVTKGSEEVEKKANAETKKGDPTNADGVITANTFGTGEVDGNGSGIRHTTKADREAKKQEQKAEKEEQKSERKLAKEDEKSVKEARKAERKQAEEERPNPNTELDAEEKLAQEEGSPEDQKAQEEQEQNQEKADETTVKPEDITNPASSQEENK